MNKTVTNYLKEIGARGGSKRKHHPDKAELAKRAANTRWNAKRLRLNHANSQSNNKITENKV